MKLKTIFPVITTDKVAESRDFYIEHLGFTPVFEQDWYVHLSNGVFQLGIMAPNHSSQPELFQSAYPGKGLILSFETDDVQAEYEKFKAKGLQLDLELQQEPWGEIHFALRDPSGVAVNITQQVEATEEYKADYVGANSI